MISTFFDIVYVIHHNYIDHRTALAKEKISYRAPIRGHKKVLSFLITCFTGDEEEQQENCSLLKKNAHAKHSS